MTYESQIEQLKQQYEHETRAGKILLKMRIHYLKAAICRRDGLELEDQLSQPVNNGSNV